jgi:hypothetical protein
MSPSLSVWRYAGMSGPPSRILSATAWSVTGAPVIRNVPRL